MRKGGLKNQINSSQFRRIHFGLGFFELCDGQPGLGYRPSHELMNAQVAGDLISRLCVFRSKLAHFCPVMDKRDGAVIR